MTEKQMTLKDFAERIMRPSILHAITSGSLDDVLLDPDCMRIIADDPDMLAAFVKRIPVLKEKYGA